MNKKIIFSLVLATVSSQEVFSKNFYDPLELKGSQWDVSAKRHNLDPYLLYSIALVESMRISGKNDVSPWPWVLATKQQSYFFQSRHEAEVKLLKLLGKGHKLIDIGLLQINVRWNGHRVEDVKSLLDPAVNISIASDVLGECISFFPSNLVRAIGCYNAGTSDKNLSIAIDYGRRVLSIYANLTNTKKTNIEDEQWWIKT